MSTHANFIVPPAPKVPATDLPAWRLLLEFSRNTLSIWPEYTFDVLISRHSVLGLDALLINDPDGVWHVLTTATQKYVRPTVTLRVLRPFVGEGIFLSEGVEWRRQRRMLAPIFTPASVGRLLPHFANASVELVKRIDRNPTANLSAMFQEATLEAVLRALFSFTENSQRGRFAGMVRYFFPALAN